MGGSITEAASINSPTGSVYDCLGYRLPTEAEWEYAAGAGEDLLYSGSDTLGLVGHCFDTPSIPESVAGLAQNAWGSHDMSGNVWEWTWDWLDVTWYSSTPSSDPVGPVSSPPDKRVTHGGGVSYAPSTCRVSVRSGDTASNASDIGVRLARTIPCRGIVSCRLTQLLVGLLGWDRPLPRSALARLGPVLLRAGGGEALRAGRTPSPDWRPCRQFA